VCPLRNTERKKTPVRYIAGMKLLLPVLAAIVLTTCTAAAASASTTGRVAARPWCTATAAPADDGWPGDYDVYVKSDSPHRDATASDATDTWGYETNSTGKATIYLWYQSPGELIKVTVGGATCWTRA
jgi:hypothetical protein